jgi:RNase H-fold protein (predicted Holliday junction resolvase)
VTAALDYGKVRTGLAMMAGGIPIPLDPIIGGGWKAILARLEGLRAGYGVDTIVLGHPLASMGRPTELSVEVEGLAEAIRTNGFEVVLVPERGSTDEAESMPVRHRRGTGRTDSLAAMVLLERYLATR